MRKMISLFLVLAALSGCAVAELLGFNFGYSINDAELPVGDGIVTRGLYDISVKEAHLLYSDESIIGFYSEISQYDTFIMMLDGDVGDGTFNSNGIYNVEKYPNHVKFQVFPSGYVDEFGRVDTDEVSFQYVAYDGEFDVQSEEDYFAVTFYLYDLEDDETEHSQSGYL